MAQTQSATLSGNSITSSYTSYSVSLGSSYSSIEQICWDFTFSGDLLDPGESIQRSIVPMPINYWYGFINLGSTAMSTLTSCITPSHMGYNEFLDGSVTGSIWMTNGTVYLQSLSIRLTNAVSEATTTTTLAGATTTTTTILPTTTTAPSQFNFSLSLSPSSGTAAKGSSVSTVVTVSLTTGSSQSVSLSCNDPATGISCSFSPASCTPPCSSTLTISIASTCCGAIYFPQYVGVVGTGGISRVQKDFELTVLEGTTTTTTTLALPQCSLESPIPTSGCNCGGINYYKGYCCGSGSGYYYSGTCPSQNTSALPPCSVNSLAPSSGCNCGGGNIYNYYCCFSGSIYSQSLQPCPTTTTTTIAGATTTTVAGTCAHGAIPSSGCTCGRGTITGPIIETSGYCCWGSYSTTSCANITQPCTDSDGLNFNVKGTGSGHYRGSVTRAYTTYEDWCATSAQLNEAFCDSEGYLSLYGHQCSYGCQNGVCLSPPPAVVTTTLQSSGGGGGGGGAGGGTTPPTTPPSICGNGKCESNEYPGNCFVDCGQYCPQYLEPSCIVGGYIIKGSVDSKGCPLASTCCGDKVCNGQEDSKNCPTDCSVEKPFCGDGKCNIGEDSFGCPSDCRGECPASVHCPDGSERPCIKKDFGCICETCLISEDILPPNCRQEVNPATGTVNVICKGGLVCPEFQGLGLMKDECAKYGGKFVVRKDPVGCGYSDCEFVEGPKDLFSGYSKCHTQEEINNIIDKCGKLGLPIQVDVKGECKVATCGRPSEQLCGRLTAIARQQIEDKCREQGLRPVKIYDESGCQVLECRAAFECSKELPEEAYKKCQAVGGEMIVKKDENGCVRFADCLRPGDDRDARIDPIERIPEAPELLEIAFKLEELRIKLQMLAEQADNVAKYYESVNSPDAERWKRVTNMFEAGVQEIDKIKNELRSKLDDITIDDLLEVRRSVRYISDVLLKDIAYVMLSTSEEITKISEKKDCDRDDGCFERAFRRCQSVIFMPEGTIGPRVEIEGLEGDTCILKASMPDESTPQEFGAVDMTCKIPNYAKGIRNPETDIFPYCEGSMVELIKQSATKPKKIPALEPSPVCEKISDARLKNTCLAITEEDETRCDKIASDDESIDEKDSCYMAVALKTGNADICEKLSVRPTTASLPYTGKFTCKALVEKDVTRCDEALQKEFYGANCYVLLAQLTKNSNLCDKYAQNVGVQTSYCKAALERDIGYCDPSSFNLADCYSQVAILKGDAAICDDISGLSPKMLRLTRETCKAVAKRDISTVDCSVEIKFAYTADDIFTHHACIAAAALTEDASICEKIVIKGQWVSPEPTPIDECYHSTVLLKSGVLPIETIIHRIGRLASQ